jgi:hypothetical protein
VNYMLNCVSAVRVKKEKRVLYLFSVPRYKRCVVLRLHAQKISFVLIFMLLLRRLKNSQSCVKQIFACIKGRRSSLLTPRKYDSRMSINNNL